MNERVTQMSAHGDHRGRAWRAGALAALLALGACAQGQGYDTGTSSLGGVGLGTAGGAGAGALAGRAIAGKHNNTLAILGGVAGNVLVDRPNEVRGQQQQAADQSAEQQRRLDYERQSELQKAQVQREIEEQLQTTGGVRARLSARFSTSSLRRSKW